ncbi:MAG: YdeI/OmpD-associated family protein [Acidobacteriota bacterium]
MTKTQNIATGVAHNIPADLRAALTSDKNALTQWNDLTPLARNEWICWTISVKKPETRKEHIKRAIQELKEGKRRPCCWMGCTHRKDKPISPLQKHVLVGNLKRNKYDASKQ